MANKVCLRHHIVLHHQRQTPCPQCRRCGIEFDSQTGLEQHLMMPKDQICEINPDVHQRSDPEDGIEDDVGKLLWLDTDGSNGLGWESTWRLLFPADQDIPDPGEHALERHCLVAPADTPQTSTPSSSLPRSSTH